MATGLHYGTHEGHRTTTTLMINVSTATQVDPESEIIDDDGVERAAKVTRWTDPTYMEYTGWNPEDPLPEVGTRFEINNGRILVLTRKEAEVANPYIVTGFAEVVPTADYPMRTNMTRRD